MGQLLSSLGRRRVMGSLMATGGAWVSGTRAQSGPTGPITLITPFPPGAATDNLSRPIAEALRVLRNADVRIVHRVGNDTVIATAETAAAAPDGRTLLLMSQNLITAPFLVKDVPYDPIRDLASIAMVSRAPTLVVVAPTSPFRTLADLIAAAKAEPGEVRYASSGLGTSFHLSAELFQRSAGVRLAHLRLAGGVQALEALVAGRADVVFPNSSGGLGAVQSGMVRALAVATPARWERSPDIPTIAETLPGFEASAWFALFAPATTPPAILDQQRIDLRAVLSDPEVQREIRRTGGEPVLMTADELHGFTISEQARWGRIIQEAGLAK